MVARFSGIGSGPLRGLIRNQGYPDQTTTTNLRVPSIRQIIEQAANKRAAQMGRTVSMINESNDRPQIMYRLSVEGHDPTKLTMAYLSSAEPDVLESNYVMAFDPTSGDLVCEGTASDEG